MPLKFCMHGIIYICSCYCIHERSSLLIGGQLIHNKCVKLSLCYFWKLDEICLLRKMFCVNTTERVKGETRRLLKPLLKILLQKLSFFLKLTSVSDTV